MRGEGRVQCPLDSSILFLCLYISYCKVEAAVSGVHCLSVFLIKVFYFPVFVMTMKVSNVQILCGESKSCLKFREKC